ncbi:MAG: hypothetical protein BAA02_12815 [Paenibacillaceae bacterium ZCTH02-B3]|nr:MAG: hypothetical protein BAA02_12815 [Paenibacillaceae bacterium ZCTH02-B3]
MTDENHQNIGGHRDSRQSGYGTIWFDENFEWINIWTSPSWRNVHEPEPNMFIVTGETYEQAIANQKAMKEKFDDDFFAPKSFP